MPKKYILNKGREWTIEEKRALLAMAKQNTPTRVIALKLQRPKGGISAMAQKLNVSLKPINQSPYNRLKK